MKRKFWLKLSMLLLPMTMFATNLDVAATRNGFIIKSDVADITTMTSVIVCVPPFREKHFYNIESEIELINTPQKAEIIQKSAKTK